MGERLYRLVKCGYVNGVLGRWKVSSTIPTGPSSTSRSLEKKAFPGPKPETWEMGVRYVPPNERDPTLPFHQHRSPDQPQFAQQWSRDSWAEAGDPFRYPANLDNQGPIMNRRGSADLPYSPAGVATPTSTRPLRERPSPPTYPPSSASRISRVPLPGFAYATLMPFRGESSVDLVIKLGGSAVKIARPRPPVEEVLVLSDRYTARGSAQQGKHTKSSSFWSALFVLVAMSELSCPIVPGPRARWSFLHLVRHQREICVH